MNELVPAPQHELVSGARTIAPDILAGYLAESSMKRYARVYVMYQAWCAAAALDVLSPESLTRWRAMMVNDTQWSPNTVNQRIDVIKRVMSEAGDRGYIAPDVAYAFSRIKRVSLRALRDRLKRHSRTRITATDMRRLCDAPDPATLIGCRDRALLATLASSGLRESEAATLTVGQIEQRGKGYVVSVKGKTDTEPRDAPLSVEAHTLILAWLNKRPILTQHIFISFAGRGDRPLDKPMSAVSVWRTVQTYAGAIGLAHIKPHDFRRFVGTQLAAKDIRKAQKALGHKRIDTTAKSYVLDDLEVGLTDNLY